MTAETMNQIVEQQIISIRSVLIAKASEYATEDRLHNFKATAQEFGGTPEEACWGFMLKHLTSVRDIAKGVRTASLEQIDEKIGDAINYLILLKCLLVEPLINGKEGM